jgi:hypothetical protein
MAAGSCHKADPPCDNGSVALAFSLQEFFQFADVDIQVIFPEGEYKLQVPDL